MRWFGGGPESAPTPEAEEKVPEPTTPEGQPDVAGPAPVEPHPREKTQEEKEAQPTGEYTADPYVAGAEDVGARQHEELEERIDRRQLDRLTCLEQVVRENREASPEELVAILREFDFAEVKRIESERKHGRGFLAPIRRLLDADAVYEVRQREEVNAETGLLVRREEIRYNAWRDIIASGTKSLFNRRTAIGVAATAAVGFITGGVSLAAGAVMTGGSIGRMSAELIDIFKGEDAVKGGTRGARREILIAESEKWLEMQQLANDYQHLCAEDPVRAHDILDKITHLYYKQGEAAIVQRINTAEKSLEQREAKLARLRGALQTVGEIAGVGAYAAIENLAGSFDPVDLDLFGKVEGQSVFHGVEQFGNSYNFLWTNADKAMGFGGHTLNHFLGRTVDTTSNLVIATMLERGLPVVLASSLLGGWSYRQSQRKEAEQRVAQSERDQAMFRGINEQIDTNEQYLQTVAWERRENGVFIPQNPEGYKYNWAAQPHTIPKDEFDFEKVPTWVLNEADVDGQRIEGMVVDKTSGTFVEVGVAAVDIKNNKIAVVKYEKNPATGAAAYPVHVMRIDDFMRQYRPIIRQEPGTPLQPVVITPGAPGPGGPGGSEGGDPEDTDGRPPVEPLPALPPESEFPELQPIGPDDQPPDFNVGDEVFVRRSDEHVERGWQIIKFFKEGDEIGALCLSPEGGDTKKVPIEKLRDANRRGLTPASFENREAGSPSDSTAENEGKPPKPESSKNVEGAKYGYGEEFKVGEGTMVISGIDTSGPQPRYQLAGRTPEGIKFFRSYDESELDKRNKRGSLNVQSQPTAGKPLTFTAVPSEGQDNEAKKSEPRRARMETLHFPSDYKEWDSSQYVKRLSGLASIVDPQVWETIGAEVGSEARPDGTEQRFVRFVDREGYEHVLRETPAKDGGEPSFTISYGTEGQKKAGRERVVEEEKKSTTRVNEFARNFLWEINEAIRQRNDGVELKPHVLAETEATPSVGGEQSAEAGSEPVDIKGTKRSDRGQRGPGDAESGSRRPLPGMKREKDRGVGNEIDEAVAEIRETAEPPVERPTDIPAVTRGGNFDTTLGARVRGGVDLNALRDSLPDAPEPVAETPSAGPPVIDTPAPDETAEPEIPPEFVTSVPEAVQPVAETTPATDRPEAEPQTDLERLGLLKFEDLKGKKIKFDNPLEIIANASETAEGEWGANDRPEDFTSETEFSVEDVGGTMATIRLNGVTLYEEAENLLPHITEVI
ncbi:hypothetical protein A3A71_00200 [Candidatus Berkelbacteria bacterium RIFCSPLOWO2_01_FULL_50_28]|uniref:Uncharacterized protein n=1 Tax=Candidatus Berkelbacteria bacterium RIFCSPLOWO2_01_FULL_50_28 TaxID=1797471 RepID=A0A1F5EAP2_9BACT|nr:MAG: hypothetical protein A2807_00130 [Candidatus Berkelbacteria bacterium RIFCSPHIGHO2_01_FULL_50_36]OGD64472.1 MAG: hypothetical protein A3A71_00200 [Candidatus Berkelbacteria bacterium RIFCSPLOWO2_01_FULL_50_28]